MNNCGMEVDTMQELERKKEMIYKELHSQWGGVKNDSEMEKYCNELRRISSEYKLLKKRMEPGIIPFVELRKILDPIAEIKKANKNYNLESNLEYQAAKCEVYKYHESYKKDANANKLDQELFLMGVKLRYLKEKVEDWERKSGKVNYNQA